MLALAAERMAHWNAGHSQCALARRLGSREWNHRGGAAEGAGEVRRGTRRRLLEAEQGTVWIEVRTAEMG